MDNSYNYQSAGFDPFMKRGIDGGVSSESTEDESAFNMRQLTGSTIASGVSKSTNGLIEIDWDNGVIKINFPKGYLKIGNLGVDPSGQEIQGIIQNDGTRDIALWGFQPNGF